VTDLLAQSLGLRVLIVVIAALLGLVIGSFLNVVIWRVPRGESIVSPPSACPQCTNEIAWYDNIPVLSWLILRAKCRNCKLPIPVRYPLVEGLTGAVFTALALRFIGSIDHWGDLIALVMFLYVAAIGVALAFIDLDTHKLPNALVLPSYPVVAVLALLATWGSGWDWWPLARLAIGAAALYAFYFILCIIGGMGFGDVKLAGVLGAALAWLGWQYLVIGAFLPFLIGGLFSIVLLATKKAGRKSGIPFGPWMILGWFVAVFVAQPVADWYTSVFL